MAGSIIFSAPPWRATKDLDTLHDTFSRSMFNSYYLNCMYYGSSASFGLFLLSHVGSNCMSQMSLRISPRMGPLPDACSHRFTSETTFLMSRIFVFQPPSGSDWQARAIEEDRHVPSTDSLARRSARFGVVNSCANEFNANTSRKAGITDFFRRMAFFRRKGIFLMNEPTYQAYGSISILVNASMIACYSQRQPPCATVLHAWPAVFGLKKS